MLFKDKPYLTPQEVARILMVSPITVRGWVRQGLLEAEQTPGGHRRFLRKTIEAFARERGLGGGAGVRKVLVVDDDREFAGYLVELITRSSDSAPEVAVAFDGFDAGRMVSAFEPDAVILDLRIPGLDGFEVCRRLKSDPTTHGIRVIGVTGRLNDDVERRILAVGAEAVLAKPIDSTRLLGMLGIEADKTIGAL